MFGRLVCSRPEARHPATLIPPRAMVSRRTKIIRTPGPMTRRHAAPAAIPPGMAGTP
jgi:hypothetical protein